MTPIYIFAIGILIALITDTLKKFKEHFEKQNKIDRYDRTRKK